MISCHNLILIALQNCLSCVQVLLDAQASAHLTNDGGLTASHIALQRGDNVLASNIYDIAICNSIIQHNLDDVIALIGVGGDPNVQCSHNHNFTPMILATKASDLPAINILIEYGADVNIAEDDGWTPLMFASVRDKSDVVERLLRAGAVVDAINNRGQSAHSLARLSGRDDIAEILTEASKRSLRATKKNASAKQNSASKSFHPSVGKESHTSNGRLLTQYSHTPPQTSYLRATRKKMESAANSLHLFQSNYDEYSPTPNKHTPSLTAHMSHGRINEDSGSDVDAGGDMPNKEGMEFKSAMGSSVVDRWFQWLFSS